MNLYKIFQTVNNDYDTFDAAIVAAESPEDARTINPDISPNDPWPTGAWCAIEDVQVERIGKAAEGITKGIILASFNAG
jgi:hypothetical protein